MHTDPPNTPPSMSLEAIGPWLERLGAKVPAPGGGAAAGLVGAVAAALARMVVAYSVGKKSLAAHDAELRGVLDELDRARARALELGDADAACYEALNSLQKLPADDPARAGLPEAAHRAARVPLDLLELCAALAERCVILAGMTNPMLRSDLAIAGIVAEAAGRACVWNVRANLELVTPESRRGEMRSEAEAGAERCRRAAFAVEQACLRSS